MGLFSAISRILKAMAVGAFMLPRIDKSVMPDGFQQIDQGKGLPFWIIDKDVVVALLVIIYFP